MLDIQTKESNFIQIQSLRSWLMTQVLGQSDLIEKMLIALLSDGHVLVEGLPGLAKTRSIRCLSKGISGQFKRIQFTPDLLPSDITGTDIYRPQDGVFKFNPGPIFSNMVLADEINRAPAKVQSALLEAMEERQVTVGQHGGRLPDLFFVMATQNPIEQEGTYPLPEAQLDRFLFNIRVNYPAVSEEKEILNLVRAEAIHESSVLTFEPISEEIILQARREVLAVHMSEHLMDYLITLVTSTRQPEKVHESLSGQIVYGASPRATIGLDRAARARAWLSGRDYVTPDDIQFLAVDVLSHRIILSYTAIANGWSTHRIINQLVQNIPAP